jgi:hypothetical protein
MKIRIAYRKWWFLAVLLPVLSFGQTVHVEDGKIDYKGKEQVAKLTREELYQRAKAALLEIVKPEKGQLFKDNAENGEVAAIGEIRLHSPYSIIRKLQYTIKLTAKDEGYKYHIDSVFIIEHERGGNTVSTPSEELVKKMEVSGPTAIKTEKQLNEIDMDLQKLLALIRADMEKPNRGEKQN